MDSVAPGATRMGSRSSTRHGGPAQVFFVGPVRKWRQVWAPVSSSSTSPSATRVVLYKWSPLAPANGGAKDDSTATPEEAAAPPTRPVKFLPVSVIIQRNREDLAREAAEEAEANAANEEEDTKESTDMIVDTEQPHTLASEEKTLDQGQDSTHATREPSP